MTPGRWIVACIAGCLFLAAALLPPQPSADEPFYRWRPEPSAHTQALALRAKIDRIHASLLLQAYRSAHDEEAAQRVFGASSGGAATGAVVKGRMSVWFDADIPDVARRRVEQIIASEDSARGSWRGKGAVGILVFTDTAASVDGTRLPWGFNSGLSVATKVLPVNAATGDRCVAVVRLGRLALAPESTIPADRQLLDGCAFYDAFGTPGPRIATWLQAEHAAFARALSFAPIDTVPPGPQGWSDYDYFLGDQAGRCAGGDQTACISMLNQTPQVDRWNFWHDGSVPLPNESPEIDQRPGGFRATLLDAMVRDIGPERFERIWQSPRTLDAAYFDVMGEPLAAWVRRRVVLSGGRYHIGPLPTATSTILTLLAIVTALALSTRFARRPSAN